MKFFLFLGAVFMSFAFLGCSQNFSSASGGQDRSESKSVTRSIDSSRYKDVTLESVNASLIEKVDFAYLVNGTFCSGDSYMKFDMEKGRCVLYTPSCPLERYRGMEFSADFIYTVKAAGKNCLYIMPSTMNGTGYYAGGNYVPAVQGAAFALYVPLYGFGESRIEVSSVLNGEICMPSGTYWKKTESSK